MMIMRKIIKENNMKSECGVRRGGGGWARRLMAKVKKLHFFSVSLIMK